MKLIGSVIGAIGYIGSPLLFASSGHATQIGQVYSANRETVQEIRLAERDGVPGRRVGGGTRNEDKEGSLGRFNQVAAIDAIKALKAGNARLALPKLKLTSSNGIELALKYRANNQIVVTKPA
jgi:hypothetical protein